MGGIAMKNRSIKEMKRKLKIFYKKFPNKEVINLYDAKNYLIQLIMNLFLMRQYILF